MDITLTALRIASLVSLAAGIFAIVRWDLDDHRSLISGGSLLAALITQMTIVVLALSHVSNPYQSLMANASFIATGIGVFRFFYDRRLWRK